MHDLAPPDRAVPGNYHGQGAHPYLGLSVPQRRSVAKAWAAVHRGATAGEVLAVIESLMGGQTYEEKTLGPLLLASHALARRAVKPAEVTRWLIGLKGWAEVDHLCQNLFPAEQMLADWSAWDLELAAMAGSDQVEHRRASLVLLVGPVGANADLRLVARSFANLERLKLERSILVSKAVSWLLRSLIGRHRFALEAWLAAHQADLAPAVRREVATKLSTGLKSGRSQASTHRQA